MNLTLVLSLSQMFWFAHPVPEAAGCRIEELAGSPGSRHQISFKLVDQAVSEKSLQTRLSEYRHHATDPVSNLELGVTYLDLANTAHWEYLDRALTYFERAGQAFPKDPLLLMFKGRTIGAKALNTSVSTLKRLNWAREGFKYMDQALTNDPACFFMHLLRGEAQLLAHPILRRGLKLDEDAQYLSNFTSTGEYTRLSDFQKARIELFLGNYKEKRKQESLDFRSHWERTISLASQSPWAVEARARLDGTFQSIGYEGEDG